MTELVNFKKGELTLDGTFKDGVIRLEAVYNGEQAKSGFYIDLTVSEYLDILKGIIPGEIDDAVIEGVKRLLS